MTCNDCYRGTPISFVSKASSIPDNNSLLSVHSYPSTPDLSHLPIHTCPLTSAQPPPPLYTVYLHLSTHIHPYILTYSYLPINTHKYTTLCLDLKFIHSYKCLVNFYSSWVKIQLRCSLHSKVFLSSKGRAWYFPPCSQTGNLHITLLKHVAWWLFLSFSPIPVPKSNCETIHLYP